MAWFPPDVKRDIAWGPVEWRHLKIIFPAFAAAALLFFIWPGGVLGRLIVALLVAGGGFVFAVIEGPDRVRIGRAFRLRPRERAPFLSQRIEDWRGAGADFASDGLLRLPDGSLMSVLAVRCRPWLMLSAAERAQAASAFRTLLEQALAAGAEARLLLDVAPDLPRAELRRQRELARRAPPGLEDILLARAELHERLGREGMALRADVLVTLAARPGRRQEERLAQAEADAVSALRGAGAEARRLSPEEARDLAWRQLCPADFMRAEPPVGVEWVGRREGVRREEPGRVRLRLPLDALEAEGGGHGGFAGGA